MRGLRRRVEAKELPPFQFVEINALRVPSPAHVYSVSLFALLFTCSSVYSNLEENPSGFMEGSQRSHEGFREAGIQGAAVTSARLQRETFFLRSDDLMKLTFGKKMFGVIVAV
jgi:hypothetical protein